MMANFDPCGSSAKESTGSVCVCVCVEEEQRGTKWYQERTIAMSQKQLQKFVATGIKSTLTFDLDGINWNHLLSHVEDLKTVIQLLQTKSFPTSTMPCMWNKKFLPNEACQSRTNPDFKWNV